MNAEDLLENDDDGVGDDSCGPFVWFDSDNLAIYFAIVTAFASVVTYFIQRKIERKEAAEAEQQKLEELDRQQALERVRMQLSVYIGPLHRLVKTQNSSGMQYRLSQGLVFRIGKQHKPTYWASLWPDDFIAELIEDPESLRSQQYRTMIVHRFQPIWTRIRDLHWTHASDLADLPTQDEYLERYNENDVRSPYLGSININVIFDTYCVWSLEFDTIVERWKLGDYSKMQPSCKICPLVMNYLVDYMYDNAKEKEAKYNKHVKHHKNVRQSATSFIEELDKIQAGVQKGIQSTGLPKLMRRASVFRLKTPGNGTSDDEDSAAPSTNSQARSSPAKRSFVDSLPKAAFATTPGQSPPAKVRFTNIPGPPSDC